jgi:uncharacterized membrane protein HdeD (DUF308 family)
MKVELWLFIALVLLAAGVFAMLSGFTRSANADRAIAVLSLVGSTASFIVWRRRSKKRHDA